jgi:6,7-dimethyl-8-ribityllumazine synthase
MRVQPTARALVVVSRFNEGVTRRLLDGARAALEEAGYDKENTTVVWVPGAFELPLVVSVGVGSGEYELAVALGAVIRGETPHFDHVSSTTSHGLMEAALRTGIPIGFGLLTCDTLAQAMARAGGAAGNKGEEAARAAIDTLAALRGLRGSAAT